MNGHSLADLFAVFIHFAMLSVLAVGGAITTVADMHRWIVNEQHWLTDSQFTASIALGQAAPGPNMLYVAALGWNLAGLLGAITTMASSLLPSSTLTLLATRWSTQRRESRGVRAFTTGMTPLTLGLLLSTGWVLAEPYLVNPAHRWGAVALLALTIAAMLKTRISPIWLVAAGAVVGGLGWI